MTHPDTRFTLAGMIAAAGAIVAFGISVLSPDLLRQSGVFKDTLPFVRVAAGGALCAGLLVAPGFGRAGGWGWALSSLSFLAATILGAVLAWLMIPLESIIDMVSGDLQPRHYPFEVSAQNALLAAFMVGAAILSEQNLLGFCGFVVFALHLTARHLREVNS